MNVSQYVRDIIQDSIIKVLVSNNKSNVVMDEVIETKRICFVSSLFADDISKCDIPGKFQRDPRFDYILLTNLDLFGSGSGNSNSLVSSWDIIKIDFIEKFRFPKGARGYNTIRSRYPKFMLWKIFRDYKYLFKNYRIDQYDFIIYCDAFLSPCIDTDWLRLCSVLRSKKVVNNLEISSGKKVIRILQDLHLEKEIRDGGIKDECMLIVRAKKDSLENVLVTLKLFRDILGKNSHWMRQGRYCLNTCFIYDFKCADTLAHLQSFWNFYNLNNRKGMVINMTYRDQPIWNFWLIKNKRISMVYSDIASLLVLYKDKEKEKDKYNNMLRGLFDISGKFCGHNMNYY